ncbi:hypothetical protein AB0O51_35655 [Streptomyces sp. NPDC090301]|uniref:hypothetical protein n=1 Tax=Streptomyces sp. NPDC090301 TaxID=3154975 RepID=UPI0034482880
MRLIADGSTPLPRAVLVDALEHDDGHTFEPASPLFLAAGDRLRFEGGALVVLREGGKRHDLVGDRYWRCRVRPAPGPPPPPARHTPGKTPL